MRQNIILATDSYKTSQFSQIPPNTEYSFSYIESRGGQFPKTVFFGLQAWIKENLKNPITLEDIKEAEEIISAHGLPFNRDGWLHILNKHKGYLPVRIMAIPEGTKIPTGNVLVNITNTDPKCAWLVSYLETALLRAVWFPTTVATMSRAIKEVILHYLELTGTPEDIEFKLHDFGARGVSSPESAAIGGAAHLVNFLGTDTIESLLWLRRNYFSRMAGFSIPASEHSSITPWGKENEMKAFRNMVEKFGAPESIYACVSDSFNIWKALDMWKELEPYILEKGGRLVIRPDSGDPIETPIEVVRRCLALFSYTINDKGYKVLPDHIRIIQGDGIDIEDVKEILFVLEEEGISADNIAFGMGGGLLQRLNRDTCKFAMKCSAVRINGQWRDVFKEAPGKDSKKGRLFLFQNQDGEYTTAPRANGKPVLVKVYENGKLGKQQGLEEIRRKANL